MREYYFKLKAGSYYLIYRGTWYFDDFTFGKATTTPTEFVDINNIEEFVPGETYKLTSSYYKCGLGKVTSTTNTLEISHNRAEVKVFDEDMNEITINSVDASTYTVNVQYGKTYYIFFTTRDITGSTSISISFK